MTDDSEQNQNTNEQIYRQEAEVLRANEIYIVEKVLDKKYLNNKWKYKIKWEGFPHSENTWEPKENLYNVSYLVEEFDIKNEEKMKKRQRKRIFKFNLVQKKRGRKKSNCLTLPANSNQQKGTLKQSCSNLEETAITKRNFDFTTDNISNITITGNGDINYDIPERIIKASVFNKEKKEINCLIEWKAREDGIIPKSTYYLDDIIRDKYPLILLDFFKKHIRFP